MENKMVGSERSQWMIGTMWEERRDESQGRGKGQQNFNFQNQPGQ